MFADDTGIFLPRDHFAYYIETKTKTDGSDLGLHLSQIFQVLNTGEGSRQNTLDAELARFPYVNGKLFEEQLPFPSFNVSMRALLLECIHFNWSEVSPAIFGSLFQSVMDPEKRRDLGGHYTAERNILKVIHPLFLDSLRAEMERYWSNERKLRDILDRISQMRFLDPACGCGNFLAITYRELRQVELEIRVRLRELSEKPGQKAHQRVLDVEMGNEIDVDAFYGIEIEEFPARIAEVALWLVDHQMNVKLSEKLGDYFVRLPLKKSPTIKNLNALRQNWKLILPRDQVSYVLGNPPYAGKKRRNAEQTEDMGIVMKGKVENYGNLDYVACWYVKALEYIKGTSAHVAFVSTQAIMHGEQVGLLWAFLLRQGAIIHFAHRPFTWTSEAKGKAAVTVIIIGFASFDQPRKRLFDYSDPNGQPVEAIVRNINPYLVDQPSFLLPSRKRPICSVPEIHFGSMPNDGGHFIFTEAEKQSFIAADPLSERFLRPLISAKEFLHMENRWCLWLQGIPPQELRDRKGVMERIEEVRKYRLQSKRASTRRLAATPYLFGEIRQPFEDYILIPRHSSETRRYIPLAFFESSNIASDSCLVIPGGSLYHFGVLMSAMHMAWVHQVAGRLTERIRYSNKVVYNNFPWPKSPAPTQIAEVEKLAKGILEARAKFTGVSLATLYDPLVTPPELVKAHEKLDKMVDRCYRQKPFRTDLSRLRFLFMLYREYCPGATTLDAYPFEDGDVDDTS
ncbi:MAG: N-6 DNA methylase [Thermoplasmata archaeon]|nr:N-6 DNA methylase [Candidatus Sysuiplasma acidicola]MBX8645929.1 N-6 DNA methylase [Candidatus Sysuiplasma acidicola]